MNQVQVFGVGKRFSDFEINIYWSPRLFLFDQIYSKKSEILHFKRTLFYLNNETHPAFLPRDCGERGVANGK